MCKPEGSVNVLRERKMQKASKNPAEFCQTASPAAAREAAKYSVKQPCRNGVSVVAFASLKNRWEIVCI